MPDQSCYTSDQLSASEPFMEELPVIANSCDCWRLTNINSSFQEECHCSSLQDQLPVSWQPSTDGHFLLGHLTLHKNITNNAMNRGAGTLLGLKVVGGKRTPSGRLGAFITKVRRGSLADIIGHLKPGDEIISWNKYCLQDATFRDVYEIILESQTNSVVELVVSRPIRDIPRIPETRLVQTAESSSCSIDSDRRDYEALPNKPQLGKVQIKLCYDTRNEQLHVTAMKAIHLTMREGGLPRNPYLKMYLLPDRSNSFKRRTKTAKKTLSPEWMQTFVYGNVRENDLGAMALELTLWDFDRSIEANNKFMGEVIVDLGLVCLNDEPHWFCLMPLGHGMNQDYDVSSEPPLSLSKSMSFNASSKDDDGTTAPKMLTFVQNRYPVKPCRFGPKRRLPSLPQNSQIANEEEALNAESPTLMERMQKIDNGMECLPGPDQKLVETMSVDHTLETFVGSVGPGQVIGRQALAMSSVGEIELAFHRGDGGKFVVHVRRALKLTCKQGVKVGPVYYVKVYMMSGVRHISKKKTRASPRSRPMFNEDLVFETGQVGNTIQVIVWADYRRVDNKVFIGSSQICIDSLDLSNIAICTYKLFPYSHIFDSS